MLTCILKSHRLCRPLLKLFSGLGAVILFLLTLLLSPFWMLFYLICWTYTKIKQQIYSSDKMTFLDGGDAFYGQENATTDSIINVVCYLQGTVKLQVIKEVMLNQVVLLQNKKGELVFPKFSQYVATRGGYQVWCNEEKFNIDAHVVEYKGTYPRSEAELVKIISSLCNQALPPEKSNWQIISIPAEGTFDIVQDDKYFVRFPQSCLLCRVHHSIADGLSLTRLILEHLADAPGDFKSMLQKMMSKLIPRSRNSCLRSLVNSAKVLYALIFGPFVLLNQALTKDKNIVHGPKLTGKKLICWTPAIALQTVKDIKNVTGTTVNDVILSCMTGSIRRFFLSQKADVPSFLHGAIPVNLQGPDDPLNMKNSITFVIANLPTGEKDSLKRLHLTKYIMDNMKRSPDILVNQWILKYCINVLPNVLLNYVVNRSPVSIIFSNVPGPTKKMFFKSHKITSIIPILPHRGTTGVGICIFSYSGNIRISMSVDSALINKIDDVKAFLSGFVEELRDLQRLLKL